MSQTMVVRQETWTEPPTTKRAVMGPFHSIG